METKDWLEMKEPVQEPVTRYVPMHDPHFNVTKSKYLLVAYDEDNEIAYLETLDGSNVRWVDPQWEHQRWFFDTLLCRVNNP
jgi:hypothetical protein